MKSIWTRSRAVLKRAATCLALAAAVWVAVADLASAAPKKKEEPAAAPTKSYTVPYMLVLALLGMGLMTVCRPTSRLEKLDDKLSKKDEEE